MIKIMHTADTHLRDMQYARKFRGYDFFKAFAQAMRMAVTQGFDAVVHAGDAFNTSRPSSNMYEQFETCIAPLAEAGIPFLAVDGNHDRAKPSWLSLVKGVTPITDTPYVLSKEGEKNLVILGAPASGAAPLRRWLENAPQADVLVWHGMVKEYCGFPVEHAFELAEFPTERFRAIMLGDIHVSDTKMLSDGTPVSYPGSTELCELGEDENKYVLEYTFGSDRHPTIAKLPVKTREVVRLLVMSAEELAEAKSRLREARQAGRTVLVGLKFRRSLGPVVRELREVLGPDGGVIRPLPCKEQKIRTHASAPGKGEVLRPEDLLCDFFAEGSEEYAVALKLAFRELSDVPAVIDAYVRQLLEGDYADTRT